MYVAQTIQRPHGINVFGSCLIRVEPDYASLTFAVNRVAARPAEAFEAGRKVMHAVRSFLASAGIPDRDVRLSRISLEQAYEGYNENRRCIGYRSHADFNVIVTDFDRLEPTLVGVVESGADWIDRVSFKTRRIREIRDQARRGAIAAARSKAESYCAAAGDGAKVGAVLHFEDIDADELSRRSHMPDVDLTQHDETAVDLVEGPGSIVVAAAVMVCYAIAR